MIRTGRWAGQLGQPAGTGDAVTSLLRRQSDDATGAVLHVDRRQTEVLPIVSLVELA